MANNGKVDEDKLKESGKLFEKFWLRPKMYAGEHVPIRLRVNKKWSGWRLKDELIESLNLKVGDTISTKVTPYFMSGIIDDDDDTDLFASESGADWLIDNNVGVGSVIDCVVRFAYSKVPVGLNEKMISKVSLVFEEGIAVVEVDESISSSDAHENLSAFLRTLLE